MSHQVIDCQVSSERLTRPVAALSSVPGRPRCHDARRPLQEGSPELSATRVLTEYVGSLSYEMLSQEAVEAAKLAVLDSIGCALGGIWIEPAGPVTDSLRYWGTGTDATFLPTGQVLPLLGAVFANATFANLLDADDYLSDGHLGSTVVPAAVALAEQRRASGRDLLVSVVAGYELASRVGDALRPSPTQFRLVRGLSTFQTLGAAAVGISLLRLAGDRAAEALGVGAAHAPIPAVHKQGYEERPLSWVKNNFGWAAVGGLMGPLLVENGFRGSRTFLDGERGFWRMAGSDRCDFELMTCRLGESFRIIDNGFKAYACCRYHHTVLDAVRSLRSRHRIDPDSVTRVEVRSIERLAAHMFSEPPSIVDAQFSLPFQVAAALMGYLERFDALPRLAVGDPTLLRLARLVEYTVEPDAENAFQSRRECPATVIVHHAGGTHYATVEHAWGDKHNPITREQLLEKFRQLSTPVVGVAATEYLLSCICGLDTVRDVSAALTEYRSLIERASDALSPSVVD